MSVATKNAAHTEEAPKRLYFPRAKAETDEEKKTAKFLNRIMKEKEEHIREGRLALSEWEGLSENEVKSYEMGIECDEALLYGLNAASAWAPGTRSARQAAMTGVDFTWEDTAAIYGAAEAKHSRLSGEWAKFIEHNWPGTLNTAQA